jgi:hypothetical protein
MKIFVLTRGRPTEMQTTAAALASAGIEFTFARTVGDETEVSIPGGTDQWFDCKTAAHKRQAIYDANQAFIMLDDDLRFYAVKNGRPVAASPADVLDLFGYAGLLMQSHGLVGIENRLWIGSKKKPYIETPPKLHHFFGVNKMLLSGKERFDRFPGHADIDFSLQVLTSGASVVSMTKFCHADAGQSTRKGGANLWRTKEFNDRMAEEMRAKWPGIVRLYTRNDGVTGVRINSHALKQWMP